VSVYGTEEEQKTSLNVLVGASAFLRGELSRSIDMRHTPALRFRFDPSLARGAHVLDIIEHHLPPAAVEEPAEETPDASS
jgi:ribosome-binding factor A